MDNILISVLKSILGFLGFCLFALGSASASSIEIFFVLIFKLSPHFPFILLYIQYYYKINKYSLTFLNKKTKI